MSPVFGSYTFNTSEPLQHVLKHATLFPGSGTSGSIDVNIYQFRTDGMYAGYTIQRQGGGTDCIDMDLYVSGNLKTTVNNCFSSTETYSSPLWGVGSQSNGEVTITVTIRNAIAANGFALTKVTLGGGNYALLDIDNGNTFVPPHASEQIFTHHDNTYTCWGSTGDIDLETTFNAQAPAHLAYGSSSLNEYYVMLYAYFNRIGSKCYQTQGVKSMSISLEMRMVDSVGGTLSFINLNSIGSSDESLESFKSLDWSVSLPLGGGASARFSPATVGGSGSGVSIQEKDVNSESGSGVGNWRFLGSIDYTFDSSSDKEVSTSFLLHSTSTNMQELEGHNIQFRVGVTYHRSQYSTLFGCDCWVGGSTSVYKEFILGDGIDAGSGWDKWNYMDTWIVAMPGSITAV